MLLLYRLEASKACQSCPLAASGQCAHPHLARAHFRLYQALPLTKRLNKLAQLLLNDAKFLLSYLQLSHLPSSSPRGLFFSRPFLAPAVEPVCQNPAPFPTIQPTSWPLNMALQQETKKVVSQFEFSDADVNSHVAEFIQQMSMLLPPFVPPLRCNFWAMANRCSCRHWP